MNFIDLTKIIDDKLEIYSSESYSDPKFLLEEWTSIEKNGFKVQKISLGTQTGTHIDAPSHFSENGDDMSKININSLCGKYFYLSISELFTIEKLDQRIKEYDDEKILFLKTDDPGSEISADFLESILKIPAMVVVVTGYLKISNKNSLYFHKRIADCGKYLVEDLCVSNLSNIPRSANIIIAPLNLNHSCGAPCRVLISES